MQQDAMSTFQPKQLPIRLPPQRRLQKSLHKAKMAISQLNDLLAKHPIIKDLDTILSIQEAIDSLGSQHIKACIDDVLVDAVSDNITDRAPVLDYLLAYRTASKQIRKCCVGHPFFFAMHTKVKGLQKNEHRYRSQQNWIGPEGGTADQAYFFPPPPERVATHMSNLIQYWKQKEKEPLIQLAIIFAQLLIIHPFMDGNGRIARLLAPLFLFQKKEITEPIFFLSYYFKRHRLAYFQNLFAITSDDRWDLWIQFFLKGVYEQGIRNFKKLKSLFLLYTKLHDQLTLQWTHQKTKRVLLFLFQHPIFLRDTFVPKLGRSQKEITQTIDNLQKKKIIKMMRKNGSTFLIFPALLSKETSKKQTHLSRSVRFKLNL